MALMLAGLMMADEIAENRAEIANIAGGIVCEEVGTVAVNKEELLKECKRLIQI